jgi:bla regulator protein blaR1
MVRISEFILSFILNSSWQIAAILVVAAIGSWLLRNGPARYRHVLWVAALATCLIVPLLTASRFLSPWVAGLQAVARRPVVVEHKSVAPVSHSGANDDLTVDHIGARRRETITISTRSVFYVALGYALFIFGRGIRLARFWQRKEKLRRSATRAGLTPEIELAAKACRSAFGTRDATVMRSDTARVPYTLGVRRPLIVLPKAYCLVVDDKGLLSVIGHEMAHVVRRDFLTNLICELVALPISFHPLTFLIKRQIDRSRELACDELVTRHVLAPKVYARSLLWAADVSRHYPSQAFMLSIFDGKSLEERIVKLMRSHRRVSPAVARATMSAVLLVLLVSALSLSLFSLELPTQVSAAVMPAMPAMPVSNPPAAQDFVAPGATASQSSTETQLNVPDAHERALAACKAGRSGDVEAIPSLIAMLGDDSKTPLVRCWQTGRWSPALETFKHPSPGEQAAIALASFGRQAFAPLSNQLDSQNSTVRRNAAWAIGELTNMPPGQRSSAVPQLINLLDDSDAWVRMAAARALGELHDERALSGLVARLSDDNWRVRELVVWALSEMKDDRAVTALCGVLLSDVRVEVRRGAAVALGEIRSAEAIPALKQALNDAEAGVSAKAAWAIAEIEG